MDAARTIHRQLARLVGSRRASELLVGTPVGDLARLAIRLAGYFSTDADVDRWHAARIGSCSDWHREHCHYLDLTLPRQRTASDGSTACNGSPSQVVRRSALPARLGTAVRLVVVSDTHETHRQLGQLPKGDVFVHCGDISWLSTFRSPAGRLKILQDFNEWLGTLPCTHKVVISGNHDMLLQDMDVKQIQNVLSNATYLEHTATRIAGLLFLGVPVSHPGTRASPNRAFQGPAAGRRAAAAAAKFSDAKPGGRVDVLVTHGPSPELAKAVSSRLHLWGHFHAAHGAMLGRLSTSVTGQDRMADIRMREVSTDTSESNSSTESLALASVCCAILQEGNLPGGVSPRNLPYVVDLLLPGVSPDARL